MEEIALVVIPRETDSDSEAESESSNEDGFTGVDKTDEILGQNLTKAPMNGKDKSTSVDPWMDDYLLLDTHSDFRSQVPKLDRMMSDIYQDELFIPASASATSAPLQQTRQPPTTNSALLSPYQTVFSERLQAANNSHLTARSQSMASTISHQRSPFRKGSPYAASGERRDSSAHVRFQQEADAVALELQRSLNDMSTTKTIAPRDALLDYEEDEDMPLGLYNSLDSQQELEQPSRSSILPDTQSDIGDTVKIDYIARDNSNHFRR